MLRKSALIDRAARLRRKFFKSDPDEKSTANVVALHACLATLATKIHGLAVKNANGKKPVQNKAIERIAALLNQAIEAEIKQAYAGITSQVRGLAEKLEPAPARKAVGRKKVSRKKPMATKKKPPVRRGRVKPTEKAVEPTETA